MQAEQFEERFRELLTEGRAIVSSIPKDSRGSLTYWVPPQTGNAAQSWINSSLNLVSSLAPKGSYFADECQRIVEHEDFLRGGGIASHICVKTFAVLESAHREWQKGLLRRIEHVILAGAFDDFLDHAALYHKGNKHQESGVLASAVLEDVVKRAAASHGLSTSGLTLEPLIDAMLAGQHITPVTAKRLKAYAAIRNHALHAEWSEYDIRDVGEMIAGLRRFLEEELN